MKGALLAVWTAWVVLASTAGCSFVTGGLPGVDGETEGSSSTGSGTTGKRGSTGEIDADDTTSSTGPMKHDVGDPGSSTGAPTAPGPCCRPTGALGCDDPEVAACVCDIDRYCCEQSWDDVCVQKVEAFGCGHCGEDGTTGDPPPPPGSCCEPGEGPGCTEASIERCVCAYDPFCCEQAWDSVCVDLVGDAGCGPCPPPDRPASCCEAGLQSGCDDALIETCVCDVMPECCTQQWTAACAAAVEELICGECQVDAGQNDCCEISPDPGCVDQAVAECVCMSDSYCCEFAWDSQCVDEVESLQCGVCDPGAGETTN